MGHTFNVIVSNSTIGLEVALPSDVTLLDYLCDMHARSLEESTPLSEFNQLGLADLVNFATRANWSNERDKMVLMAIMTKVATYFKESDALHHVLKVARKHTVTIGIDDAEPFAMHIGYISSIPTKALNDVVKIKL